MRLLSTLRDFLAGKPAVRRSPKWPALEKQWLKDHGECMACGGKTHLQVHHCRPVHLFPRLELSKSNLMTLCQNPAWQCHRIVGHCGNWKDYRQNVDDAAALVRRGLKEA